MIYNPRQVEKKWQQYWEDEQIFKTQTISSKPKYYILEMYPYPSGELHMGHVRNYILGDVVARYKRMQGFNILHPIGWDSFGLPTENAAINRSMEPTVWNENCITTMTNQFRALGISYDWGRVINTASPDYYSWTQWFLIRCWEKGLLYQKEKDVNWCTGCNTVLANEQVTSNGCCERCESSVIQKKMEQWFLKITTYKERLKHDLELLKEWPARVIAMQKHWLEGLQDWCISRQRYWGAPIPFVNCPLCGIQPVADDQLPVVLPQGVDITPGWPPPLSKVPSFIETECPCCGKQAKRIADVMDTFVFSAWYYLRFTDSGNMRKPFDSEIANYWMPVDQYVGGIEHATVHLIYARFFYKVLYDLGIVDKPEPFHRLFTQGMVCRDGMKMSKSKGNIVKPDEMIRQYGADVTRLYTFFLGPPEQDVDWIDSGVKGCKRLLERLINAYNIVKPVYNGRWKDLLNLEDFTQDDIDFRRLTHKNIYKVSRAIDDNFHFHTVVATFMEWINIWEKYLSGSYNFLVVSEAIEMFLLLLSPFAPHLAEECWEGLGFTDSISQQAWPEWDKDLSKEQQVNVILQINGKTKHIFKLSIEDAGNQERIEQLATHVEDFQNKKIVRKIFIPCKLINFVIE